MVDFPKPPPVNIGETVSRVDTQVFEEISQISEKAVRELRTQIDIFGTTNKELLSEIPERVSEALHKILKQNSDEFKRIRESTDDLVPTLVQAFTKLQDQDEKYKEKERTELFRILKQVIDEQPNVDFNDFINVIASSIGKKIDEVVPELKQMEDIKEAFSKSGLDFDQVKKFFPNDRHFLDMAKETSEIYEIIKKVDLKHTGELRQKEIAEQLKPFLLNVSKLTEQIATQSKGEVSANQLREIFFRDSLKLNQKQLEFLEENLESFAKLHDSIEENRGMFSQLISFFTRDSEEKRRDRQRKPDRYDTPDYTGLAYARTEQLLKPDFFSNKLQEIVDSLINTAGGFINKSIGFLFKMVKASPLLLAAAGVIAATFGEEIKTLIKGGFSAESMNEAATMVLKNFTGAGMIGGAVQGFIRSKTLFGTIVGAIIGAGVGTAVGDWLKDSNIDIPYMNEIAMTALLAGGTILKLSKKFGIMLGGAALRNPWTALAALTAGAVGYMIYRDFLAVQETLDNPEETKKMQDDVKEYQKGIIHSTKNWFKKIFEPQPIFPELEEPEKQSQIDPEKNIWQRFLNGKLTESLIEPFTKLQASAEFSSVPRIVGMGEKTMSLVAETKRKQQPETGSSPTVMNNTTSKSTVNNVSNQTSLSTRISPLDTRLQSLGTLSVP